MCFVNPRYIYHKIIKNNIQKWTGPKTLEIQIMYIPLNIWIHKYPLSDYKTYFIIKFASYIYSCIAASIHNTESLCAHCGNTRTADDSGPDLNADPSQSRLPSEHFKVLVFAVLKHTLSSGNCFVNFFRVDNGMLLLQMGNRWHCTYHWGKSTKRLSTKPMLSLVKRIWRWTRGGTFQKSPLGIRKRRWYGSGCTYSTLKDIK